MKIVFDHQIFSLQYTGGISRYFARLIENFISLGEEVTVLAPLYANHYIADLPSPIIQGLPVHYLPPKGSHIVYRLNQWFSRLTVAKYHYDVLHETYYSITPTITNVTARVITIHDMIPEQFPHFFKPHSQIWQRKQAAIRRADHIICVSHKTKADLCDICGISQEKLTVVYLGVDTSLAYEKDAPIPIVHDRPFLLYVGKRSGYKNFSGLLKAIATSAALRNTLDVIAFGGGPFTRAEWQLIQQLGLDGQRIRQVSGGDVLLAKYYRAAAAFIYPSLYEGFGLPPLEAMLNDCPVVVSNRGAIPEIVGPAGEYFDPDDPDAIAKAIIRAIFDQTRRTELIAAGRQRVAQFSWRRCAEQTRDVYQQVLKQNQC
ncbi:MAG: glycosyltransferase family 4 protein [Gloeomargarita sp. SKYB31]|nr:glycosyltransferase family 4 protein [Gloeomargarita sp. SKYB31]